MAIEEKGHLVAQADRKRIPCDRCRKLGAVACEYMRWAGPPKGIAFYYFCAVCWIAPGPYGDSPRDRTGIEAI